MIKPDTWIENFGKGGGITPFLEDNINPASYDVRLSDSWVEAQVCPITGKLAWAPLTSKVYVLRPGEVVLASTIEYFHLPHDVAADLKLKSTLGRSWINHTLAGWVDPGFQGTVTMELQNIGKLPYTLEYGTRVAQLIFMSIDGVCGCPYGKGGKGRYHRQVGATTPRTS